MARSRTPTKANSSSRAARSPGARSRPRPKASTKPVAPVQWGWQGTAEDVPTMTSEEILEALKQCVESTSDAVALVGAVRHCQQTGREVPAWILDHLESWLAEYVAASTPSTRRPVVKQRFATWARQYLAAWCDHEIASRIECAIRVDGLTRKEAIDKTACELHGTELARGTAAVDKAWKRARRRARAGWFQRQQTEWEGVEVSNFFAPYGWRQNVIPWDFLNRDRKGPKRGEWRERPRLLAGLSPAQLSKVNHDHLIEWLKRDASPQYRAYLKSRQVGPKSPSK
jgi:hypothetical protein